MTAMCRCLTGAAATVTLRWAGGRRQKS